MQKRVAVILVNFNTPVHTANCILSINTYCNQADFDIIVVDNGSADGSLSALQKQFPALIYIDNKQNLGFAEGNNVALRYSITQGYQFSLVINTDTLVDSDIITGLAAHLNAHPYAAAVQPAIYWMHKRDKLWNGPGYFNALTGTTHPGTGDRFTTGPYRVADWLSGCCMFIRNTALQRSGLFNPVFFLYYEDVELSLRLRRDGYELHYLPQVKMFHEAGISGKSAEKQKEGFLAPVIHYYTSRNHIWVLRRYGKTAFYPVNWLRNGLYYLAVLCYFKIKGKNEKAAKLLKGIRDGLFTPQNLIWPEVKTTD